MKKIVCVRQTARIDKKMEESIEISEILQEIRPIFLNKVNESITEFRQFFGRLAEKKDDFSAIENIYRMAHNMHGNGASYGLPAISEIAGQMEDALDAIYPHQKEMDEKLLHFLEDRVDSLEKVVQEYEEM